MAGYQVGYVISQMESLRDHIETVVHIMSEDMRPDMAAEEIVPPEVLHHISAANAGLIKALMADPVCLNYFRQKEAHKQALADAYQAQQEL